MLIVVGRYKRLAAIRFPFSFVDGVEGGKMRVSCAVVKQRFAHFCFVSEEKRQLEK